MTFCCFFLQVMLRCLPPVSFFVVTSLLLPMETHRLKHSKVRFLGPSHSYHTVDFEISMSNIRGYIKSISESNFSLCRVIEGSC